MNNFTTTQVEFIHNYLVEYFKDKEDPVSPPGIKDRALLESSVGRPFMSAGCEEAYVGLFNKAAALFHSIINNHCFYNGNKRAALLATLYFLSENKYWVTIPTDDELLEFTRKAAAHELCENRADELSYIGDWFKKNSRRRSNNNNTLKFHDLKSTLSKFGFELGSFNGKGSAMEVLKGDKVVAKILKKGSKGQEDYDKEYINNLRKKLNLTPEYGIDSDLFYSDKITNRLSKFMKFRYKVMWELAKI